MNTLRQLIRRPDLRREVIGVSLGIIAIVILWFSPRRPVHQGLPNRPPGASLSSVSHGSPTFLPSVSSSFIRAHHDVLAH